MTKLSFICVARHFIQIQHKKVKGCSKQTKHVSACEVGPGFHRVEYLFFFLLADADPFVSFRN